MILCYLNARRLWSTVESMKNESSELPRRATRKWVPSSKCHISGCPMTLCTPIGDRMMCWMHMLWIELPDGSLDPERIQR